MQPFKVLMIDDEPHYPEAFKFLLEAKGNFQVFLAAAGKDGIDSAKKNRPDLIFLDIMMPGDDGIEVLKKIRADEELKKIPVVMMTAVGTEKARKECSDLNVEGYLNKPLEMEDIIQKVEEVLAKKYLNN